MEKFKKGLLKALYIALEIILSPLAIVVLVSFSLIVGIMSAFATLFYFIEKIILGDGKEDFEFLKYIKKYFEEN